MAGKIVADTLEHSTAGSIATNYVVEGSAKQWSHFQGQTSTLEDSFNTSSLNDRATGQWAINTTASFGNNNFSAMAMTGFNNVDAKARHCCFETTDFTTSQFTFNTTSGGTSYQDHPTTTTNAFGDLA